MGMRRLCAVLSIVLALCAGGWTTSEQELKLGRELQQTARQQGSRWFGQFQVAFLGVNHLDAQPAISKLMTRIGAARSEQSVRQAFGAFRGDRETLTKILDLAVDEAKVWNPTEMIRKRTINELWQLLYRGPPEGGQMYRKFRLESFEYPDQVREWLIEEQKQNARKTNNWVTLGSLPRELDPLSSPVFWLSHVEIPVEEAKIMEANQKALPVNRGQIFVTRGGKQYVRYFIHPGSYESPSVRGLMEQYGVKVEFVGTPTASSRSLVVWNPYTDAPPMLIKTSLSSVVGTIRRINALDKALRAITNTNIFNKWQKYWETHFPRNTVRFMPESLVVSPAEFDFWQIVREAPEGFPKTSRGRYVAGNSLIGPRPGKVPLLVEMIRKSGLSPMEFAREKVLRPILKAYTQLTFEEGMIGEPHQQNILLEVGKNGQPTGNVLVRDLDCYKMDVELRLRRGMGVGGFWSHPEPGLQGNLKFAKGRYYYDYSYQEYVRDWAVVFGSLTKYFPSLTESTVKGTIDGLMAEQIERRLGIKVKPGRWPLPMNEIVEEYRQKMAAEPVSEKHLRVSQEILRQEVKRLEYNRRVIHFQSMETPSLREHQFLLHDGAIEMRKGTGENTKVIAIAFLEPEGSGSNFYKVVPYPRKAPNATRLSTLYKQAPNETRHLWQPEMQVVGWPAWKQTLQHEGAGMARFAVAYALKEGVDGFIAGEGADRLSSAWRNVTQPQSLLSLGVFSVGSQTGHSIIERSLQTRALQGVPKPVGRLVTSAGSITLAMAGVDYMNGERDGRRLAESSAGLLVGGSVLEAVMGPAINTISRPVPKFVAEVTKLALMLYAAEGAEAGIHWGVDRIKGTSSSRAVSSARR